MTNEKGGAVTEAARAGEIGFPEFTAKLIVDVFDALIAANIRQTEAYIELVDQVSKTLREFITDTKDDISGEMILQFLGTILNADPSEKVKVGGNLTGDEAKAINNATKGTPTNPNGNLLNEAGEGNLSESKYKSILDAVAERIAADKYTMLKEMVKMGILRIVVEHGVIETRLLFTTHSSTYYESKSSTYHRERYRNRVSGRTGSLVGVLFQVAGSTSRSSIKISTSSRIDRDVSGSHVQIYGYVRIDFKTDYQPMRTP